MKGSSSPNDTPKPRKKLPKRPFFDSADRHEKLYGRSRLYASAQGRHETGGVLSLFSRLSFDISIQNSVQRWSSDFQGLFRVKIRKIAQGSDDLSTLPLKVLGKKDRRSLEVASAVPWFWRKDRQSLPTFVSFMYISMGGMSGKHSAELKTPRRRGQHLRRWNQRQSERFYQTCAESFEVACTLRSFLRKKKQEL